MPNIIFYLNTGSINKKDNTVPLNAKIHFKGKRYYRTIARIKAIPEIKDNKGKITAKGDWNLNKNRVNKNHPNAPYNRSVEINATINELERLMTGFNDYCLLNQRQITENDIKQILNGIDPMNGLKSANRPEIDFNQAFEKWVEYSKDNKEYNTYRSRNTTLNFYKDFQKKTSTQITFHNLNMNLFDKIQDYAFKREKPLANNTFARRVKNLRMFLSWCRARDYYNGILPNEFTATERDISPIILTFDEFKTLYSYDFKNKKHQKVRDIFCFGCVTGLRYSDLNQLRREHIQGDNILLTMKKVKEVTKIPLNQYSRPIIEKYKEQPIYVLPRMSNQKLNDYVEEICRIAEINTPVMIDTYNGNQFTQESKPKHEVVTVHTARKTFITLSYYLGMSVKVIMEITGIKNERTLRKYLHIVDEMKAVEMKKAWG